MDNLDTNPFYQALVSRFKKQLNLASKKCYVIAIPQSKSLQDVLIDESVINSHILMPSKLLKAHFVPIQGGATDDIEIDQSKLIVHCKSDSPSIVPILREEIGVNSDNKHYRILIIDSPLIPILAKKTSNLFRRSVEQVDNQQRLCNHDECHQFLEKISQSITSNLEQSVKKLQSTYLILPKYLDEASNRIRELVNYYSELYIIQASKSGHTTLIKPIEELILLAVETYLVHLLHGKLVAAIYQNHSIDDKKVSLNCKEILRSKMSILDLGAQKAFKEFDKTGAILSQLRHISYLQSPLSIVTSMMQLVNMISDQLNSCVSLVNLMNEKNGDKICICSDDLIASLVYSVSEAQPLNFFSSLKYVELFGWSSCNRDQSAYCLATFQVVANYILTYIPPPSRNLSNLCLSPSSDGMLTNSLKEWSIDHYTLSSSKKYKPTKNFDDIYGSAHSDLESKQATRPLAIGKDVHLMSPFERELEKITSIVETNSSSTIRKDYMKQDDDLGELLSNIGQQPYIVSYGRQK